MYSRRESEILEPNEAETEPEIEIDVRDTVPASSQSSSQADPSLVLSLLVGQFVYQCRIEAEIIPFTSYLLPCVSSHRIFSCLVLSCLILSCCVVLRCVA